MFRIKSQFEAEPTGIIELPRDKAAREASPMFGGKEGDVEWRNQDIETQIPSSKRAENVHLELRVSPLMFQPEQFQAIAELMPVPVVISRVTNGIILYANELFGQTFGVAAEELIGRPKPDFYYDRTERQTLIEALNRDGSVHNYEIRVKKADGTPFWVSVSFQPVTYNGFAAILGTFCDITERKRATLALRSSEGRLRRSLAAARMGVWDWDIATGKINCSDEVAPILGLPQSYFSELTEENNNGELPHSNLSVTADAYFQTIHADDRPIVELALAQAIASKTDYNSEHRILHRESGTVRWIGCKGNVLCDTTDKVVRLTGTIADITARKTAESALTKSEANLRAIFNSSLQSILLIDPHHKIQAFNKTANVGAKLVWKKEIQQGDSIYDYVRAEDLEQFNEHFQEALSGISVHTQRNIKGIDNTDNWFEVNYHPVFNETSEVMGVCFSALNINERKKALDALAKSEERFRSLVQNSSDLITILEADGTIRYESPSIKRILGYEPQDLVGKNAFDYIHPEDMATIQAVFANAVEQPGLVVESEFRFSHASGGWVYLEAVGSNLLNNPSINGFVVNSRDVTERKQHSERLRLLDRAIAASSDGIAIADAIQPNTPLVYVNPRFEEMTGYSAAEAIGHNCRFLQAHDRDQPAIDELRSALKAGKECEVVLRNYRKDGTLFWNDLRIAPVYNAKGQLTHFIGVQTDISDRKAVEEQLIHQAFYDPLTGLPNRALLIERLREASARSKQQEHYLFAVLFLDLDRFKVINDSLGHAVGDMLLIVIAHRLESCLAEVKRKKVKGKNEQFPVSKPFDFTVARLGGDHYAILLEGIQDAGDATRVAEQIHKKLKAPFTFEKQEVFVSASIGIALSCTEYECSANLLRDADIAMYRAKASGKARHAVFDKAMRDRAVARLQLETDLRRAIERLELKLAYQPIVSLATGRITGFEALVRWHHPERGFISPAEFIPVAEETGSILPLGAWVLREACRQMREWQLSAVSNSSNEKPLTISVNLSGKQLLQPDLVQQVDGILQETGLDASCLKLEITESVLMENTESAIETLEQLRNRQIKLCLDDFGTGYSSLSYLHQFPIHTLKIDRSFVNRMEVEGKNTEIVRAIVTLAHGLGMDVTAEGVETAEQVALIGALGCEQGQGYFFAKPLDSAAAGAAIAASPHW